MKHFLMLGCSLVSLLSFAQKYPVTNKVVQSITKHGITYNDDYAWLEKMSSPEVTAWVAVQNKLIDAHFTEINTVGLVKKKLQQYSAASTYQLPVKRGKYFYTMVRLANNKPSVLVFYKTLDATSKILVDPSKYYTSNASISAFYPSRNSRFLAYSISADGSDKREVRFVGIDDKNNPDDLLTNIKYSNISWNGDKGVFYNKNANTTAFARDSTYQMFYHVLGTKQTDDVLVFDTTVGQNNFRFRTMEDKLFIEEHTKDETRESHYYINLNSEPFIPVKFLDNVPSDFNFAGYIKGRVYTSKFKYEWGETRSADINNLTEEKVIIPQFYGQLLTNSYFYSDYIVAKYKVPGRYYLSIYDAESNFIRKFEAPYGMDIVPLFLEKETSRLFITLKSYVIAPKNFTLNLKTGELDEYYNSVYKAKPSLFPLDYFEVKTIIVKSRDNKEIPLTIIHKKGIVLNGDNPTLLKAYGGFGAISSPSQSPGLLYFLEQGGVFAFAEVRGGGERGLSWQNGGRVLKKQNTFNDFIDAALFLIDNKYTSPRKLGITGASHGGLVVGAAMTQRPELFKIVICQVGVLDMLKASQYTVGGRHLDEYGDPDVKNEYINLLSYSPYQNIKPDVNYPTSLIITAENDDRVAPLHSFKFAAALQNRTAQKNEVYLKTIKNSGHSGGNASFNTTINEEAEFYSFLLYHLNK
jgi:prolyl oligopeptidase